MKLSTTLVASFLMAGAFCLGPALTAAEKVRATAAASRSRQVAGGLNRDVLQLALNATSCAAAAGRIVAPDTLTVIDYSRASTLPRFWVLDLETREVLFEELVAHGSGSGDNLATRFSNQPDSHQSSLGLFVTEQPYVGKHGYSLRLNGLEPANDRALERAIVIHGASYVDEARLTTLGRLGRSWGCPALRPAVTRGVIDRIKNGGVVFAYYPDRTWLQESPFLRGCASAGSVSAASFL